MLILVTTVTHKSMEGMGVMPDFKVDRLGFYSNNWGSVIKVVHISNSEELIINVIDILAPVLGISVATNEVFFYEKSGEFVPVPSKRTTKRKYDISTCNLVKFLGEKYDDGF